LKLQKKFVKFAKDNYHLSQREIGEKFGISREHAKDIINYKSWKTP